MKQNKSSIPAGSLGDDTFRLIERRTLPKLWLKNQKRLTTYRKVLKRVLDIVANLKIVEIETIRRGYHDMELEIKCEGDDYDVAHMVGLILCTHKCGEYNTCPVGPYLSSENLCPFQCGSSVDTTKLTESQKNEIIKRVFCNRKENNE